MITDKERSSSVAVWHDAGRRLDKVMHYDSPRLTPSNDALVAQVSGKSFARLRVRELYRQFSFRIIVYATVSRFRFEIIPIS